MFKLSTTVYGLVQGTSAIKLIYIPFRNDAVGATGLQHFPEKKITAHLSVMRSRYVRYVENKSTFLGSPNAILPAP